MDKRNKIVCTCLCETGDEGGYIKLESLGLCVIVIISTIVHHHHRLLLLR